MSQQIQKVRSSKKTYRLRDSLCVKAGYCRRDRRNGIIDPAGKRPRPKLQSGHGRRSMGSFQPEVAGGGPGMSWIGRARAGGSG